MVGKGGVLKRDGNTEKSTSKDGRFPVRIRGAETFVLETTYIPFDASSLPAKSLIPMPSITTPPVPLRETRKNYLTSNEALSAYTHPKHQIIQIYFSVGCLHFHVSRYPISCKLTGSPTYLLDASWCHPAGKGEDKVRQNLGPALRSNLF